MVFEKRFKDWAPNFWSTGMGVLLEDYVSLFSIVINFLERFHFQLLLNSVSNWVALVIHAECCAHGSYASTLCLDVYERAWYIRLGMCARARRTCTHTHNIFGAHICSGRSGSMRPFGVYTWKSLYIQVFLMIVCEPTTTTPPPTQTDWHCKYWFWSCVYPFHLLLRVLFTGTFSLCYILIIYAAQYCWTKNLKKDLEGKKSSMKFLVVTQSWRKGLGNMVRSCCCLHRFNGGEQQNHAHFLSAHAVKGKKLQKNPSKMSPAQSL